MLVSRKFTNAEIAERLQHCQTGARLGMPSTHMEGLVAEAITRLSSAATAPVVNTVPMDWAMSDLATDLISWVEKVLYKGQPPSVQEAKVYAQHLIRTWLKTRLHYHDLYETGDADAPSSILDRNGEVTLDLCRVCGMGEAELDGPCPGAQK